MNRRQIFSCLGVLLLVVIAGSALATPPADADIRILIDDAGTAADHPGSDLVTVFDRTDVTMEDSGLSHVVHHSLTKILTAAGARDMASQRFEYDPATQLIEIRRVIVHRRDGAAESVDLAGLVEVTAPAHAIYWGMHQKSMTVPGLRVGDAVEVETYRKGFQIAYLGDTGDGGEDQYIPPMRGHFYDVILFQGNDPIVEKTYTLRTPRNKPVQFSAYNGEVSASQTFDDAQFTYRFWKRNVGSLPHEYRSASPSDIAPKIVLATVQDWPEKSRWFFATNDPVFADNEAIRAKVAELTDGLDSDQERIAAINHWVAQNIRYVGLNMGEGEGYTIHPGEMIFRERSGVCKDIAGMTITMLRSAGFTVYPAMTMAGARVEEIPADQFNHCVAALKREDGTFQMLDPTWIPFSRYGWSRAEGEQHYVIGSPEGEQLTMTPAYGADENVADLKIRGRIDPNGELTGELELRGEGYIDTRLRRSRGSASLTDFDPSVERWLSHLAPGAVVEETRIGDPADFSRPCVLKVKFRVPGFAAVGERTATWLPLAPRLITGNFAGTSRFPDRDLAEERETPAALWYGQKWLIDERISPPRGYHSVAADKVWLVGAEGDAAWCDIAVEAAGRDTLLKGEAAVRDRTVQTDDWPVYRATTEILRELGGTRMVARRKGA